MSDLGNKEIFAKNLKYYMELNSKSRNDLARELEIPYTTITSWYNAEFYPRIDKIEQLASYFCIEKSDLIESKSNKEHSVKISQKDMETFNKIKPLAEDKRQLLEIFLDGLNRNEKKEK